MRRKESCLPGVSTLSSADKNGVFNPVKPLCFLVCGCATGSHPTVVSGAGVSVLSEAEGAASSPLGLGLY